MTRKPRGKKTAPKTKTEAAKPSDSASESQAERSQAEPLPDGGSESPASSSSSKTSKLPAFGFAADLLASRSEDSATDAAQTDAKTTDAAKVDAKTTDAAKVDAKTTDAAKVEPAKVEDLPAPRASTIDSAPPDAATSEDLAVDPERIFHFADSLEREEEEETVAQRLTTWITFSLEGETFALPVEPVREVLRLSHITRVPHAPRPIRGVTNLRGRVIPVIDLRVRIELPAGGIDRSTRVIVVGSRGRLIGLMVDAVHQVAHIDLNRVQPPPDDVMTVQSDYLAGVYQLEDRLILLLDVDRALILRDTPAENFGQGAA